MTTRRHDDTQAYVIDDIHDPDVALDFEPSVRVTHPELTLSATWLEEAGPAGTPRPLRISLADHSQPAGTSLTELWLVNPDGNDIPLQDIYLA